MLIECLNTATYICGYPERPATFIEGVPDYRGPLRGPLLHPGGRLQRAAIFVDAGYLFAQGSVALAGAKQPRTNLTLNPTAVIAELRGVVQSKASSCELLRVYWYDGAIATRPTLEQMTLAHTENVKLRLGFINSIGQQKGVDSLIVTDLIDLARNHAISDAILLSGDEDVRIAVQIAQQFGVRVHLVGIIPVRGSQSRTLQQEADTTTEWEQATVARFLSVAASTQPKPATPVMPANAASANVQGPCSNQPLDAALDKIVIDFCAGLDSNTTINLKAHWQSQFGIPPEYDGKLIARGRAAIGRPLTMIEKKAVRTKFKVIVQSTP